MMTQPAPQPAPIEVAGVSKWFGSVVAVNDASFQVFPGVTGLLGPNGAGKTTLLNMMCGLTRPSRGRVRVLGRGRRRQHRAVPSHWRDAGGTTPFTPS